MISASMLAGDYANWQWINERWIHRPCGAVISMDFAYENLETIIRIAAIHQCPNA